MAAYAVIENGTVTNVIIADSLEIAQEATQKTCVEYTEESPLGIGWYWLESANAYIKPAPFASWTYDVAAKVWNSPIEMPVEEGKFFTWDESTLSWVEVSSN
jgi:hypothetical protein